MRITDKEVIEELIDGGGKVEDFFLIGNDICRLDSRGAVGVLLIDDLPGELDGEMHDAVVAFLHRRGAKVYDSMVQYQNRDEV
jgi:hypothetical protein